MTWCCCHPDAQMAPRTSDTSEHRLNSKLAAPASASGVNAAQGFTCPMLQNVSCLVGDPSPPLFQPPMKNPAGVCRWAAWEQLPGWSLGLLEADWGEATNKKTWMFSEFHIVRTNWIWAPSPQRCDIRPYHSSKRSHNTTLRYRLTTETSAAPQLLSQMQTQQNDAYIFVEKLIPSRKHGLRTMKTNKTVVRIESGKGVCEIAQSSVWWKRALCPPSRFMQPAAISHNYY